MKIQLNIDLRGLKKGSIVKANDAYWRKRIEDAKTDNCVTIIKSKKKKTQGGINDNSK